MAAVISVTSGKGGVGKTNVVTNLGLALASRNFKVCVFDADTGLANINILLGVYPQYSIEQVLDGSMSVSEILLQVEGGMSVAPAASGVGECVDLSDEKRRLLVDALQELEQQFDYILIDTAAGIDSAVLDFVASAQYRVVVITPEPTSLTDAFALLKMLKVRGVKRNLFALVNRAADYKSSSKVFERFRQAAEKYLQVEINYLGYLADDAAVNDAVSHQVPVVNYAPNASVSCCFTALADIVKSQFLNEKGLPYFSHYWRKIAASAHSNKKLPVRREQNKTANKLSQTPRDLQLSDIYTWLEKQDYPEAVMGELIVTLENLYEKKHRKPVKSVDSLLAELLADAYQDEEKTLSLHNRIEQHYLRRYGKPIGDPKTALLEQLQDESVGKQTFKDILQRMGELYQQRFGVKYFGDGERLLEDIARLLRKTSQD